MIRPWSGVVRHSTYASLCLALLGGLLVACNNDPSSPTPAGSTLLRASRSASTGITVAAASPDSASTDTTLDVTISGSGFASDAVATWALNGTPDATQVRTNSTRYVNPNKVVANITISSTATVASWDVIIYSGKKSGIGSDAFAIKARHVTIPTVSLTVTVSNTDNLGTPYAIQNDGAGAYVDGTQDVQAVLDDNGTFAFNTETGVHRSAVRYVTYDFNNPVDPANTYRPTPSNLRNYHFTTGASQHSPEIPIQNLGVNGNPTSECIYMGNSFATGKSLTDPTTSWRVSFHAHLEDVSNTPTAFAVVTRTSVSPAAWTITPAGACSPVSNVASLRSGDGSVLYGYYNLPFFFTLRAK